MCVFVRKIESVCSKVCLCYLPAKTERGREKEREGERERERVKEREYVCVFVLFAGKGPSAVVQHSCK